MSRSLHVDLHAELHDIENGRPADSAPYFARLARFSFNWLDPSPKNLESRCSSRHRRAFDRELLHSLFRSARDNQLTEPSEPTTAFKLSHFAANLFPRFRFFLVAET